MKRAFISCILILGLFDLAIAQDLVKLKSGGTVRGEIVEENDVKLEIITQLGELKSIDMETVERTRRGRPLKKRILTRLEGVDAADPAAVFEVATWANGVKTLQRGAKRLARRVLVLDSEHENARALLGHVKALGSWYVNQKSANKALEAQMTADGYVLVNAGWVKIGGAASLNANPDQWMLIDNFKWRPLAEVMTERGFINWNGEWYPGDEKKLVEDLKKLESRVSESLQGAQVGVSRVYTALGRERSKEVAANIQKARDWFIETFEVGPKNRHRVAKLPTEPLSTAYVLSDQTSLEVFVKSYKAELKLRDADLALSLPLKHCLWSPLGHGIHLGESIWEYQLVSQMGGSLMGYYWHDGFRLPAWIWTASAHHAEIHVFGSARVQYISKSRYDKPSEVPETEGRDIAGWTDLLRDYYDAKRVVSLRNLFGRDFNNLTGEDDVLGVCLFDYLRQEKKEAWFRFLTGAPTKRPSQRWEKYFGQTMEESEIDFKAWLKKN